MRMRPKMIVRIVREDGMKREEWIMVRSAKIARTVRRTTLPT